MLLAALLNFKSACFCMCVFLFLCGGLRPLSLFRAHTVTAGLNTQQISGVWTSSLSPAASCQWGMLTLIDGAAVCQGWPRLACGVHYRVCDSSWGGEQCVIHIMLHTKVPLYASELRKGVSFILGNVASMMSCTCCEISLNFSDWCIKWFVLF